MQTFEESYLYVICLRSHTFASEMNATFSVLFAFDVSVGRNLLCRKLWGALLHPSLTVLNI